MKIKFFSILAVLMTLAFTSCDDYETYGEKKEKERGAHADFTSEKKIKVIDDATFEAKGQTTSVADNEYVYLEKSGVYMQIERKGAGEQLEEGKQVNILCRYTEYNINDGYYQTVNIYSSTYPEKFTVTRSGSNLTASFTQGTMLNSYSSSVPEGWLVPLLYINVGRQTTADEEISKVNIIVPHSKGQAYAMQSVYACHYTITYQRER